MLNCIHIRYPIDFNCNSRDAVARSSKITFYACSYVKKIIKKTLKINHVYFAMETPLT